VRGTIGFALGLIAVATSIAAQAPRPAPRWPDGRVRLGAPSGGSGYWASPSARTLTELNAKSEVAPFMPWSRSVFLYRQQTKFKDDPVNRCLPPGGPRQFQQPQGVQFVEQREVGRILVLLGGGNRNWRIIHTDGRPIGESADAQLLRLLGWQVGGRYVRGGYRRHQWESLARSSRPSGQRRLAFDRTLPAS
jgi:hypothetical protein